VLRIPTSKLGFCGKVKKKIKQRFKNNFLPIIICFRSKSKKKNSSSRIYIGKGYTHRYRKAKIDCLSLFMCPLLAQLKIGFFSSYSAAAVYSTNETNKAGLKQSIIFRCLWLHHNAGDSDSHYLLVLATLGDATIDIERPKIDCLSVVMCPLLAQLKTGFFSIFFAAAVYRTTEQTRQALSSLYFLDVYGCSTDRIVSISCHIAKGGQGKYSNDCHVSLSPTVLLCKLRQCKHFS
jgi:hypothetical protein